LATVVMNSQRNGGCLNALTKSAPQSATPRGLQA
jgi:hypothetical protein